MRNGTPFRMMKLMNPFSENKVVLEGAPNIQSIKVRECSCDNIANRDCAEESITFSPWNNLPAISV